MLKYSSDRMKAFTLMAISAFFGAIIAASMKALSFHSSIAIIFFFSRVFVVAGAIPTIIKYKKTILHSENKLKIILVSIFYLGSMYGYLYSLTMIPMSISSLFVNSAPLYVPVLAHFVLGDSSMKSKKLWIAMFISFFGVCLIVVPHGHADYSLVGFMLAFLSGVSMALWQVFTKKTTGVDLPHHIAFFQMISSIFISAIPAIFIVSYRGVHSLDPLWTLKNMNMLVVMGIASWIYQLYRTKAMTYAPVSVVMPFGYLGVIFVGLLDYIFWGVIPQLLSVVGMIFVVSGVVYLLRSKAAR